MQHHPDDFLEYEPIAKEIDWRGPASIESFDGAAYGLLACIEVGDGEGYVIRHDGNRISLFYVTVVLPLSDILPEIFEHLDAFVDLDI